MALLQRLYDFLAKPTADPAVAELYRAAVGQARHIDFYQKYAVPDTLDGRFDMLLLHMFMIMRRLSNEGAIKQQLFDLMFADMDRNLREMGVGDMSVGKKIRPMISAFYGRIQAYEKALGESDGVLAATLGRNLYGAALPSTDILQAMAKYVRRSIVTLEQQRLTDLMAGHITFASPVTA